METVKTPRAATVAGNQKWITVIGHLLDTGRPDPDNPPPPGPLDPYIRRAYEKTMRAFGPSPEPWGQLNPQPLPPRAFFIAAIAREVISMVTVAREIDAINHGEEKNAANAPDYISRYADDWCGTMWLLHRFPRPRKPQDDVPRPNWSSYELNGLDLIVLGTEFQKAALHATDKELQQSLLLAADKLSDTGLEKMENTLSHHIQN